MNVRPFAALASALFFCSSFAGPKSNALKFGQDAVSSTVFVENKGQWNSQADFFAQGKGVNLWITNHGPVYDFVSPAKGGKKTTRQVVRVSLVGGRSTEAHGQEELQGKFNYFLGKDRRKWATDVRRFKEVQTGDVYDGVSVRYYAENGSPRYDLTVAPGADPAGIAMKFDGADGISVLPNGNLQIKTALGKVEEGGLTAYQEVDGKRSEVACRMVSEGNLVSFDMGAYDPSKALVIDPLVFCTFVTSPSQLMSSTAIGTSGNVYVVGSTSVYAFPDFGGAGSTGNPSYAFICELNSTGSQLIYGDFIGEGDITNFGLSASRFINVGVDTSGNAYAMGVFAGPDFPTVGPAATNPGGILDPYGTGGFLIKVNPAGNKLVYSQLLGLGPLGMAVDAQGDCFIDGYPLGCPATAGAFRTTPYYGGTPAANFQSMVAKIDPTGTKLLYATYLPMMYEVWFLSHLVINNGPAERSGACIALDQDGDAVVIGSAQPGFPTTPNALFPATTGNTDVVARLSANGGELIYATYLGSGNSGECFATKYDPYEDASPYLPPGAENTFIYFGGFVVAEDAAGNVAICGETDKGNIPVTTPVDLGVDPDHYPVWDYLMKLNPKGEVIFSRNLSWMTPCTAYGVGIDGLGNVVVACNATTGQSTTPDGLQPIGPATFTEPYIAKYDPTGKTLLYGTYFGVPSLLGNQGTLLWSLSMRSDGVALISGAVSSDSPVDFPTTKGAYETTVFPLTTSAGDFYEAGFLAEISVPALSASITLGAPDSGGNGDVLATLHTTSPMASQSTVVYIQSSSIEAVPPSVINLPAGSDSETFLIYTKPVAALTTVTISAILFGETVKATMVLEPGKLTGFYVTPTSVIGGVPSDAVIRFGATAPSTGYSVAISSAKPAAFPTSIAVPAGWSAVSYKFNTIGVTAATTVPLKATYGTQTISTSIAVLPAPLKSISPTLSVVTGGVPVKLTVSLGGNPGPSGDTVTITHTGPISLPATAVIPASEMETSFTVTTTPVAAVTTAKVTATFAGTSQVATITIEAAFLTQFYISPTTVTGGQPSDGVLRLDGEAPSTGDTVTLSATGPVTIPTSAKIPALGTAVSFPFKTVPVSASTAGKITAKLGTVAFTSTITVNPAVLTSFTLSANTVVGGKGVTGTITLNGLAGPGGDLVSITGAGPVSFTHYAIIPANGTTVSFPISTNTVTAATKVTITASLGSVTMSQTITIDP